MNGRWALGPEVKRSALAGGAMLYDTSRAGNLSADWFEPRYWEALGALAGSARGRAAAQFVNSSDGQRYVLRHYRRGGLLAHLSGLPVPAPIAARYHQRGSSYTGDIITERLPVVGSLAECLRTGALATLTWVGIGRCIRRFHDLGVCHADLNAHNVLLSEESVYLIDFDRCQLRAPGLWRDANLVRLRRSLEKVTWALPAERFGESDWYALLDGYRQPSARSEPPPA